MSWAAQYIGRPWVAGAQGPQAFDCWSFFRHVQARHFGVQVPVIVAADPSDPAALVALFAGHAERKRWQRAAAAVHGAAVIVRGPLHIGTWLALDGGGVLHCVRGAGVVFTKDAAWPCSGFGRRELFIFQPPPEPPAP